MRWALSALCTAVLVSTITVSILSAEEPKTPVEKWKSVVDSADKNGDKRIDRGEYNHWVTETFYLIDEDKDGYLTLIAIQKVVPGVTRKDFETADQTKDGKITMEEYNDILFEDFEAADKNSDGTLTMEEIRAYYK